MNLPSPRLALGITSRYPTQHRRSGVEDHHAYALVKSNQGAPGVDGQSFWGIESQGLDEWLSGIRDDLRAKTYGCVANSVFVGCNSGTESLEGP